MVVKAVRVMLVLFLGLVLTVVVAAASAAGADGPGVFYVAPGADCGAVGVDIFCYDDVQSAVDAAPPGAEIRVAAGVYTHTREYDGITLALYISKTLTVRGGYTLTNWNISDPLNNPTILDAQEQGGVVYIADGDGAGDNISPTLQGLHITGGKAPVHGGGVYVGANQAVLKHNWIYSNSAQYGGGLFLLGSSAIISENVITLNSASHSGGGLYLSQSDALLNGNNVADNSSRYGGGGVYLTGSDGVRLRGNVFVRNKATGGSGGGVGLNVSTARFEGNIITSNRAMHNGGGMSLHSYSDATLVNNIIANNYANLMGSGVYVLGSSSTFLHTTIANNSGGNGNGLYADELFIWNLVVYSSARLTNTIVSNQAVGAYADAGNTVTLESTLWHENGVDWDGGGTIEHSGDIVAGDPMFVSPAWGDYHIGVWSAARDAGVDAGVSTDVDGEARSDVVDLGADEFHRSSCAFLPGDECAFYGDLHSHTGYSDGVAGSTPQQAFEMARANGMDFFATSDHGFLLSAAEWENTLAQALAVTQEDYFVALRGFEWTDASGHINVFGTDNFISACDPRYNELDEGYAWLSAPAQEGAVAQFNHPGISASACDRRVLGGRVESLAFPAAPSLAPFDDLAYDPWADARINLLEIGNSHLKFVDEYNTALSNGWHVAPTNDSDAHSANWGVRRARVGVIAAQLNQGEVLDALRARRTFSTEDKNLVLALQADGYWMGSRISSNYTRFDVYAFDPGPNDPFDRLELYKNGELFTSTLILGNKFVWSFTLSEPISEESWWYARAVQGDGDEAFTSPVWTVQSSCRVRLNDDANYMTVQEAVDASSNPSDVVKVAGRCVRPDASSAQVVYISKTLTVRGGYTVTNWSESDPLNNPTILDAQGEGRVIHVSGDVTPTIEGLHITGGRVSGQGTLPIGHGGGAYVHTAHAIFRNNWIYDNAAEYGGGMSLVGSDATVSGNVIESNVASLQGGGLYLEQSAARLDGNVITANASGQDGGGLTLYWRSDAILSNNVIAANQAETSGSGVYVWGAFPVLLHNTLTRNSGGDGVALHVTTGQGTGSLIISSTARLTNTIFSEQQVALRVDAGNSALLAGTLWHDNQSRWSGTGSVVSQDDSTGDPAFVNPGDGDYHIGLASAARDVGVQVGLATDIDGEARPSVGGYDVGADEFWSPALELKHEANPNPVHDGGRLTYTISITNTGAVHLHAMVVDTLPQSVLADENLAGTVLLPGGEFVWSPVITAPGGVWVRQVVVTTPLQEGSLRIGLGKLLTNVVQVSTLQGVSEVSTQTTLATWVRANLYLPLLMQDYLPMRNMLLNPGFEGLGVPLDNDAPNPGNWTRDTFNGIEYGEIFTPEGWVTWWEEGSHRRPEARVIPREVPYTFDPLRIYEGYYAASYFTLYSTHHAGYYQQVTDLDPGAALIFYAHAHGWSCNGDVPLGYSCDNLGNLGFYVGVDPAGGTDPWSPNVIWSARKPAPDVYRRIGPLESVVGPGGVVTVFLRSDTWWPFKHNDAYWDNAALMVDMPWD